MSDGSRDFTRFVFDSVSDSVDKVFLVVKILVYPQEGYRVKIEELVEEVKDCLARWWPCEATSTTISWRVKHHLSRFRMRGGFIVDAFMDSNAKFSIVDWDGAQRLVPLDCVVSKEDSLVVPPRWEARSEKNSIFESLDRSKYFVSSSNYPPMGEWRCLDPCGKKEAFAVMTTVVERPRPFGPKLDVGYIYMMIDNQERADSSLWVKIGMTGASYTPQDRLVALRTGNPNLMLGASVLVANPKSVESRLHSGVLDIAERIERHGSKEFFRLKPGVSLFELNERILKLTFAHRIKVSDILERLG